ncbi:ferredoxin [Candidatus Mycobacterium wuenschmannii]|uniref:Ferredoxin n=1 Tax=Candidatus Mycobacterium wuenschmannii TaxID=3027808 RepID=A0ABY8VRH8_9MYCO|nr:ferredoxin [Candidatus Mycobacterium wuenschmannii]WIM86239.1 ferredoxin [Candidatus Mycobacterium wuenschmannii]
MSDLGDDRLVDCPLESVACERCGSEVLVRKSSWNQTSVQWNADAVARCLERRPANSAAFSQRGVFLACGALNESIVDGVRRGAVAVVDHDIAKPVEDVAT